METASLKKADVNVYVMQDEKQKLVLQVEVDSGAMRETVTKAIYGAADLLRFLRYSDSNLKTVTVVVFPNMEKETCVGIITVSYESLKFCYMIKWLTELSLVWNEIGKIFNHNIRSLPCLPDTDVVNDGRFLTILTPGELKEIGGEGAEQVESLFHVMVDSKKDNRIYKVITSYKEIHTCTTMYYAVKYVSFPIHFVVMTPTNRKNLFYYEKVPYGPLEEDQAYRYMKTLTVKIFDALKELHKFGYAHCDVRLPNVCFNSAHDAVLIDVERCRALSKEISLEYEGCMYRKPETMTAKWCSEKMDFVQLGWLILWLLNPTENYHNRYWEDQPEDIKQDSFLELLVLQGTYANESLETSTIVKDTDDAQFSSLF